MPLLVCFASFPISVVNQFGHISIMLIFSSVSLGILTPLMILTQRINFTEQSQNNPVHTRCVFIFRRCVLIFDFAVALDYIQTNG